MNENEDLWVEKTDNGFLVGLKEDNQDTLGEVKYVDLPSVGQKLQKGDTAVEVEAQKAVIELESPVDGEVIRINEALADEPQVVVNKDSSWMYEVRI
ncbi:glycine cleavage system protein H [Lactobacillus terrae]|uniref:glycine cleavage system protein H n=1 Tax=Lactobacillus terrae TaxID=2269374 RepID=UPI000C1B78E4|nr:glycine cleavage system protein H [Lactobacillus terrae]